ncbi:MAG: hypothetical protein K0V04_40460 [Deltaproteobacteria bacterium]|nr:hypothetical protein [Deltaproteobacteria bacterium]
MIRVLMAMAGLTAWLVGMLSMRAWIGGKAYATRLLGSEALADQILDQALTQTQSVLLDMSPWSLLLALSVAVSAALVLGLLWPADAIMARLSLGRTGRLAVGVVVGAIATAAVLRSIHPLLSLPTVPEGPRTVLNYACEAAGYGWINAIAYIGGIGTGAAFGWMGRPRPAKVVSGPSSSPTEPAAADDGPGSSGDEAATATSGAVADDGAAAEGAVEGGPGS